jgi:murein tripeptide amidase MpaA
MPRFHVTITGEGYDAMADLVRKYKIGVARHTLEKLAKGRYKIDAHATATQLRALESGGYKIKRREDADKTGKRRQKEIRKLTKKSMTELEAAPVKIATAGQYLNVVEVEAALAAAAAPPNDSFTKLVRLPNKTWENRICNAIKIAKGGGANRPGIFFVGGIHSREWGSCDILINFVQLLTNAYRTNTSVTIGPKTFSAASIQKIVNEKDVVVFPQANPDGRNYSMTKEAMWRKNRRPAPGGSSSPSCVGVDLNRNYDFLWNFPHFFDPSSPIANSTSPCDHDVYIGPSAFSEPESKNVRWVFDSYPNVRFFIDVHSYSEAILYNWGDDDSQSTSPSMNFRNSAFDGKRGIVNDTAYKEYIKPTDKAAALKLANGMRDAIKAVRGRTYSVMPSIGLYPTAGTSTDYAFSRHILDATKAKVYSYTIEWGSASNPTPFHPPYSEMLKIIREITSALFDFCIRAT